MIKVRVENKKQFDIVISSKIVDEIIISRDSFPEKDLQKLVSIIKANKKIATIMLERISRYEEIKDLRISTDKIYEMENLDSIIIQNLDSFAYMLRKIIFAKNRNLIVELNHTMNCYNFETKKIYNELFYEALKRSKEDINVNLKFTAPVELNTYELLDVGYDTILTYGYIDTMVSANCLKKNTKGSDCKNRFSFDIVSVDINRILDRKNKLLYYKNYCKYCYNKIFNTDVLFLLDQIDEYKKFHNMDIRIDFTIEDEKEVAKILNDLKSDNKDNMYISKNFTRGHIKNSIN